VITRPPVPAAIVRTRVVAVVRGLTAARALAAVCRQVV
jgi:hypothetical protein